MHELTNADIKFIKAYKRLKDYVLKPIRNIQFARLMHYQEIAKAVLKYATAIDEIAKRSSGGIQGKKYAEDDEYKRTEISKRIRDTDLDLLAMLKPQNLHDKEKRVCIIYANMVLNHENHSVKDLADTLKRKFP